MVKISDTQDVPKICVLSPSLGVDQPGHLVLRDAREGQLRQARHNGAGKQTNSHPLSHGDNDKSRSLQHLWRMCADPLQIGTVHINSALMN